MTRSGQEKREAKTEERHSCFTAECGKQSLLESESYWTLELGGHAMLEGMFPRVKLERKTVPQNFVAANGEQIRALCAETLSFKELRGFTDASYSGVRALSNLSSQCRKSSELET